jgi:hypothetical protein
MAKEPAMDGRQRAFIERYGDRNSFDVAERSH